MVLDLMLIGVGIALEPFPLTAFILILSAEKGTRKGLAFVLGWLACLIAVIAAVVLSTGGNPPKPQTAPSTAGLAVKLALGVVLILLAARQRRRMGRPRKTPGWMSSVDRISLWGAPPGGIPSALGAGRSRRRDSRHGQALHHGGLHNAGALLFAGHLQLPVPGAVRDVPAGCRWRPARADASLAGHSPGPDRHPGLSAAGLLARRKSIYLLVS